MTKQKIPPIFIINLLRDIDKKSHIMAMLKPLNVNYQFFEAVDGKQLTQLEIAKIYDQKKAKKLRKRDLVVGELGCSLSHLGIYKKMIAEGIERAIILEDDAVLEDGFLQVINEIESFPNDWELVLLGYGNPKYDCKIKKTNINNLSGYYLYQSIAKISCTHGYIINQNGAKKILNENQKIYNPIDHFTGDYKTVNFYAIYPKIVNVNSDFLSDIGTERYKKKYFLKDRLKNRSKVIQFFSSVNQRRKNVKWLRKLECLVRVVKFKIKDFN